MILLRPSHVEAAVLQAVARLAAQLDQQASRLEQQLAHLAVEQQATRFADQMNNPLASPADLKVDQPDQPSEHSLLAAPPSSDSQQGSKSSLPKFERYLADHSDSLTCSNLFEVRRENVSDKQVPWPIVWLLQTVLQRQAILPTHVPKFEHSDELNNLTERFVSVRNDARRIERFFHHLECNVGPLVDRVSNALDVSLIDEPTTTTTTTTMTAPPISTSRIGTIGSVRPTTVFCRSLDAFRCNFSACLSPEALLERTIVAQMFSPLITLFEPTCDQSIDGGKKARRADWAFKSCGRKGEHFWLFAETKSRDNDHRDATAVLLHLQSALRRASSGVGSSTKFLMRPGFNIGLRIFASHYQVQLELSLLTHNGKQWFYYLLPSIPLHPDDHDDARRLIATLVLVGTLIHITDTSTKDTRDDELDQADQFVPAPAPAAGAPDFHSLAGSPDGDDDDGDEQQAPGGSSVRESELENVRVSEQAALSSFALLPERPLPRDRVRIVSRSNKSVVFALETAAETRVSDDSIATADHHQLLQQQHHQQQGDDVCRAQVAIKVTKRLAEAAVEVAALHRLRGVKGVLPLLECFRLAKADDPLCSNGRRSRVALVMPLVTSQRSMHAFRNDQSAFKTIVRRLLRVLNECHMRRVAHGDVRTANILVDSSTLDVTLIDFGFATIDSRESLIGMQKSRKEDLRQVALVIIATMCEMEYGSRDYEELLSSEWRYIDFEPLLKAAASRLAKWQVALVHRAIEWGHDESDLSFSEMHEYLSRDARRRKPARPAPDAASVTDAATTAVAPMVAMPKPAHQEEENATSTKLRSARVPAEPLRSLFLN